MKFVNENKGVRLDVELSRKLDKISRKQARELVSRGEVLVDGKTKPAGFLLKGGESIQILKEILEIFLKPELAKDKPLKILFEDQHLIAVFKEREIHTLRLSNDDPLTLADQLVAYHNLDLPEAGLVQRLDYYTSGVILAAKTKEIQKLLREAFSNKKFEKTYTALVEGVLERGEFEIKNYILSAGKKVKVLEEEQKGAQLAESKVRLLEKKEENSLVRITTKTGRRHQIRAQLAEAGHPLVGDELYGAKSGGGFYLLAESLRGVHPITGEELFVLVGPEYFLGP